MIERKIVIEMTHGSGRDKPMMMMLLIIDLDMFPTQEVQLLERG